MIEKMMTTSSILMFRNIISCSFSSVFSDFLFEFAVCRIFQSQLKRRSSWCWIKVPGRPSPTHLARIFWGKLGSLKLERLAWSIWATPAIWIASSRHCSWPQSEFSIRTNGSTLKCASCIKRINPNDLFLFSFRRHVLSLNLNGSNTLMKKLQLLFAFLAHTQVSVIVGKRY